jgi:hypothetical protein
MCQFSIGGKQHKARGIKVQSSNRNPTLPAKPGQPIKNRWPALRILPGTNLAHRFVIKQCPRTARRSSVQLNPSTIDKHAGLGADLLPDYRHVSVNLNPAMTNPVFDLAPGAQSGVGE